MSYTNTYEWPVVIDYSDFEQYIEKKYGFDHRDYAGKYSKEGQAEAEAKRDAFLISKGFKPEEYKKCLDKPEGSDTDWPLDSEEMKLRVAVNTVLNEVYDTDLIERPYQDWWHQHCDDVQRGAVNYISLADEDYDGPKEDWVCEINAIWREELKDHPAYDAEEQTVSCFIDW